MTSGSSGLAVDDVRLIRAALVRAVDVARAGLAKDPPELPPDGLRRVLGFRRLQGAALETVRRVLDNDDEFRRRVVESADEDDLGRAAWLWLSRPEGGAEELANMAKAAKERTGTHGSEREVSRLRRALTGAEETARRHAADAARAQQAERRLRAELGERRTGRRETAQAVAAAQAEARQADEERGQALARLEATEAQLDRAQAELEVARAALHEAETELVFTRRGVDVERSRDARRGVTVERPWPEAARPAAPQDLGRRIADAAAIAADLSDALTEAAGELSGERSGDAGPPAPGSRPGPSTSASRHRGAQSRSRRPAALPPGVWEDVPEAAVHLLRLPGAVVLVDGYNVARTAWQSLTPEEERSRLVAVLEELHARTGAEVVVVFDGLQEGAPMSGPTRRTVRVRFTAAGVQADDVIRDLIDQFPAHRPVIVVSSDREVADGARTRGANSVSSRQFLTALGR